MLHNLCIMRSVKNEAILYLKFIRFFRLTVVNIVVNENRSF